MIGPEDAETPSALHPIFFGSFDWHSCVHGWWQILRLLRLFPDLPEAEQSARAPTPCSCRTRSRASSLISDRPGSAGFERPYGWAWLLALHGEAARHPGAGWAEALAPLARAFADRFHAFLPKLSYPIRVGTHPNSSFALVLAHGLGDGSRSLRWPALIASRALDWFGADRDCQAWEPGGDEFLSPR